MSQAAAGGRTACPGRRAPRAADCGGLQRPGRQHPDQCTRCLIGRGLDEPRFSAPLHTI